MEWRVRSREERYEAFPERSKGIHHDPYMRLFWQHHGTEIEHLSGVREWLDRLQKQLT